MWKMKPSYYVPLFSKIVDSSLWDEPDYVVKIFITILVKKDKDDIVRASAYNISRWARKTEAEVLEALKILSSPDSRRLEPQLFEGRRIERVEGGWKILNAEHYQREMRAANRREYLRDKQAEHRERVKAGFAKDPIAHMTKEEVAQTLANTLKQAVEHSQSRQTSNPTIHTASDI